jgi:ABC-type transport system involved in multi-copper enzyme maturation permease subunit
MIWLTWRQFRTQAVAVWALVAAFGILLLVTGPPLVTQYRDSSFAACHSNCGAAAGNFLNQLASDPPYHMVYLLGALLIILLPAVIGLFWGAPLLARELESGSFRLAWNQSVTRERWLAVKLGVLGLASMAAAGVLSLILGWWASPIDDAAGFAGAAGFQSRFFPLDFGTRGIAPIGYAAFAFALGVLVGLMIRRTVAAMGITLALIVAVQIAFPLVVRPHLITPVRDTTALTAANQVTTSSGSTALGAIPQSCQPQQGQSFQACATAIAQKNLKQVVAYQPASRYWAFQWIETGIYLTVAILLAWGCFWWVRRRLS